MKIIWEIPKYDNPQTGGEKIFNHLAELLKSKDISVISTYHKYNGRNDVVKKILTNMRNYKRLLMQDKQSIIFQNSFNCPEYVLANALLHLFRRKIIIFVHEIYEDNHLSVIQRWGSLLIHYIYFWSASLIVVNSQSSGDWTCRYGNFQKKLFLMYPIVNPGIKESKRIEMSKTEQLIILCVGKIRHNKGQIYLLQAMKDIEFKFKIVFAGSVKEFDYMETLMNYIKENKLADKIEFTGFLEQDQLFKEYEKADIVVTSTLKEGFGVAVFEAMSFGLPVVASKTGGIVEQITDGQEGFLVSPRDSKALANGIRRLIADPELRIRMGALGRKRATELPTLHQVFKQFYQKVLNL